MPEATRNIDDIMNFRTDISPFLVHLTKDYGGHSAKENLKSILRTGEIRASNSEISDVRFGGDNLNLPDVSSRTALKSVCFTETPLEQIHCLLNIEGRAVNLTPYGLLFLKDKCIEKGVNPVIYINNYNQQNNDTFYELFNLINDPQYQNVVKNLLPLASVFSTMVKPPNAVYWIPREVDFTWEREWRLPAYRSPFRFDKDQDVFVGLCPHEDIEEFEREFRIKFVDPLRNPLWYATKLVELRRIKGLTNSVV
jgi:hypothetical protein